jgi:2-oxo-4-hydroxy-4-carboxy--5-ureidoimidazoline (OHCU) decarboxylase
VRLTHTEEQERATALAEIGTIGRLRLMDAVSDR